MSKPTAIDKIRDIIAEQLSCDPERVMPETSLSYLGADSLDLVEIGMAVKDDFKIVVDTGDDQKWERPSDIARYVEEKLK